MIMMYKILKYTVALILVWQLHTNAHCGLELNTPDTLEVATSGKFPPFNLINPQGKLIGIEVELMEEICQRLGLNYKPVLTQWDSILIGVLTNKFDLSTEPMDITPERSDKVLFVNWLQSSGVFVVNDNSSLSDLNDIKAGKVGTVSASTWEKHAKELGITNLKYYPSETLALIDLLNGNLDAVITDKINADFIINQHKVKLKLLDIVSLSVQKGWAINKERGNLHHAVQKTLTELYEDGTYTKIISKYINHDPYPQANGALK